MEILEILRGLGYGCLVVTLIKLVDYKYLRNEANKDRKFNFKFWLRDNLIDYFILLGVSFLFIEFSTEIIDSINPIVLKFVDWQIPHVENTIYYFLIVPVILSVITYKFFRNRITKRII